MSAGGVAGLPGGVAGSDGSSSAAGSGGRNPYGTGGAANQSLFKVSNSAWCGFLNSYGVWTSTDGVSPIGVWTGYSDTVNIDRAGNYTVRVSGDNHVRFYVNNSLIGQFDSFTTTQDFTVQFSQGANPITIQGYNDGGPAGFALAIIDINTNAIVWNTSAKPGVGGPGGGYGAGGAGGGNPGGDGSSPGGDGTHGFVTITWG